MESIFNLAAHRANRCCGRSRADLLLDRDPRHAELGLIEELRVTSDVSTTTRRSPHCALGSPAGGTDLSPYCEFGGAVPDTTIDRFPYAFISPRDGRVVFSAKDLDR